MCKCQYFITIDLAFGFHQIVMEKDCIQNTNIIFIWLYWSKLVSDENLIHFLCIV